MGVEMGKLWSGHNLHRDGWLGGGLIIGKSARGSHFQGGRVNLPVGHTSCRHQYSVEKVTKALMVLIGCGQNCKKSKGEFHARVPNQLGKDVPLAR